LLEGGERAEVATESPTLEYEEEEQGSADDPEHHEAGRPRSTGGGDVEVLLDPGEEQERHDREQEAVAGNRLGELAAETETVLGALPEAAPLDPLGEAAEGAHDTPRPPDDDHEDEHEAEPDVPGDRGAEVETGYHRAEQPQEDHQPEDDLVRQDQTELELPVAQDASDLGMCGDVPSPLRIGRPEALRDSRTHRWSQVYGGGHRIGQANGSVLHLERHTHLRVGVVAASYT